MRFHNFVKKREASIGLIMQLLGDKIYQYEDTYIYLHCDKKRISFIKNKMSWNPDIWIYV